VDLFDDARWEDKSASTKKKQKLTPDLMCAVVAALQPEDCVVVDESLTSGTSYWDKSAGCPRFQHLTLTGGAIGLGPCASVGAAVAAGQSRRVVNLQADGCCAYAPQALWTQARERLNVVTIVCANRRYAILELEKMMQRTQPVIAPSGVERDVREPASKRLTSLADPSIDWTEIARGFGVPATRADCPESFARALKGALEREGPSLIEAVLE
jgi:acetolactate synthase-1/2/3 large subunit